MVDDNDGNNKPGPKQGDAQHRSRNHRGHACEGGYIYQDRRHYHELSDRQMDELAHRIAKMTAPMAAELAKKLVLDDLAATVGRGIISKLAWAVGIAFIAVALWLAGTGHIKP